MNVIFDDLLTILNEVQSQLEEGSLELDGINANNVEYIKEVVRSGRESMGMGVTH